MSEMRIYRENIFGKFVAVVNRKIYTFADLGNFRYFFLPRNQLVKKKECVRFSNAQNFILISM